jgi:hypothetical protein
MRMRMGGGRGGGGRGTLDALTIYCLQLISPKDKGDTNNNNNQHSSHSDMSTHF